jgi:RNA-binding protein 25
MEIKEKRGREWREDKGEEERWRRRRKNEKGGRGWKEPDGGRGVNKTERDGEIDRKWRLEAKTKGDREEGRPEGDGERRERKREREREREVRHREGERDTQKKGEIGYRELETEKERVERQYGVNAEECDKVS